MEALNIAQITADLQEMQDVFEQLKTTPEQEALLTEMAANDNLVHALADLERATEQSLERGPEQRPEQMPDLTD